jgi:hypothetical protein
MISHHIFYQLVLLGLLWLCMMLHVIWPSDQPAPAPKLPQPVAPSRTRSKEPKPFAGLPRQPHCDACAQARDAPTLSPSPVPPPTITSTRGRHRHIDTSHHFCPHPDCAYGGWFGLGNLSANGHPNGGPWRQLYCSHCGGYFLETHGTIFHGKRVSVDLIVHVLACLAEDFLPFVNPNLSHFLPHLHDRLTTNPACIIARTMTQHGHQDTQESVANIA